nr:MAG TPA: hypothetical protein [Caudoviricetes sp.]
MSSILTNNILISKMLLSFVHFITPFKSKKR